MLCERGKSTLMHWLNDCEKVDKGSMITGEIMHEEGKGKVVDFLRVLEWKKDRRLEKDGGISRLSAERKFFVLFCEKNMIEGQKRRKQIKEIKQAMITGAKAIG